MRRRLALGVLAALALLALLAAARVRTMAGVGTGYAAKTVCSCVHVGGQPFAACVADLPPDFDRVTVEPLPDGRGVRASAMLGLVTRRALHDAETGCALQP
jgi:hypothetical protein